MRSETKHTNKINALIKALIEEERMRDQRSLFKKIQDDVTHSLEMFLERRSKIN